MSVPQQVQENAENVSPSGNSEWPVSYVVWKKPVHIPVQLFEE